MTHKKTKSTEEISSSISEQELNNSVANLASEMTPERDLWSGIERAINQKEQETANQHINKPMMPPVAWAASFVMAVLVSWLTFSPNFLKEGEGNTSQNLVATPVATEQLVTYMQNNFQQQKKAMLVSLGEPDLAKLSAAMQKELQQLSAAQESIRQALLKDENNVDLLNLLDFTQQQELKLLTQLYQPYQMI